MPGTYATQFPNAVQGYSLPMPVSQNFLFHKSSCYWKFQDPSLSGTFPYCLFCVLLIEWRCVKLSSRRDCCCCHSLSRNIDQDPRVWALFFQYDNNTSFCPIKGFWQVPDFVWKLWVVVEIVKFFEAYCLRRQRLSSHCIDMRHEVW